MSFSRIVYLYCDGPLCESEQEPYDASPPTHRTLTVQRAMAAKYDGWRYAGQGRDLCFDCREKLGETIRKKI